MASSSASNGFDDLAAQRPDDVRHHHPAVERGKVLRPADRFDIVVEMVGAFREVRQVLIGQVDEPLAHVLLGELDEEGADGVADPARPGMQHHPHPLLGIETEFDEVVAGAERAEVHQVVGVLQPRMLVGQPLEALGERCPGLDDRCRGIAPGTGVALAPAHFAAMRYRPLDRSANALEVVGQVACHQRGACCHHAAADVDTHSRRDNGTLSRDDRADGGTDADMYIGHRGDMLEDERHLRRALQLVTRLVVHGHAAGPHLDRHAAFDMLVVKIRFGHWDLLSCSCMSWSRRRGVGETVFDALPLSYRR